MINNQFDDILKTFQKKRDELICKLVSFVASDTILFLPKDSGSEDKIKLANEILGSQFIATDGIEVLEQNLSCAEKVKVYLDSCPVKKQVFIYLAATELRSVLSAILMAEKKINMEEAFELSFYEELSQQKAWGVMPEAEARQQAIKSQLKALIRWFDERSIS